MERHFDDDLNKMNTNLLKMAALTEEAINNSVMALKNQDKTLAKSVIKKDSDIDDLDIIIEEQIIDLLARYQPMAIDLRFLTTAMHINTELERIADLAVNISHKVVETSDKPLDKAVDDLPRLSNIAQQMVKESIDSFVNRDQEKAKKVIISDSESDELRNSIMKFLIDYMVKNGKAAPKAVPLLLVARDLERICDRASAIAEDVIYMVEAKFVKHHTEQLQKKKPKK